MAKTTVIQIVLPDDTFEKLQAQAKAENRSNSNMGKSIIQEYYSGSKPSKLPETNVEINNTSESYVPLITPDQQKPPKGFKTEEEEIENQKKVLEQIKARQQAALLKQA